MRIQSLMAIVFPACGLVVLDSHAQDILLSIDGFTDKLVSVDPKTAAITEIGSLGASVEINDLAMHDNRLFGIDIAPADGSNLVEIDPATGALLSSVPISLDGQAVTTGVESLAADDVGLIVGLWTPSAKSPFKSNGLGQLSLDGVVTDIVVYNNNSDFDGLGAWDGPSLYAIDREPGTATNMISTVTFGTSGSESSIIIIPFDGVINGIDDCAVFDESLLTLDSITRRLHHHNLSSGQIESSIPYNSAYQLAHLVIAPSSCQGDINGDLVVDTVDLLALLGEWGGCKGCDADLNGDGAVDTIDLLQLLGAWGGCS